MKPKVVLRERDSSDPRDNRKPSAVILRPSSVSAASRTTTPLRTVRLEAPQQSEPARQVFAEEQPQGEMAAAQNVRSGSSPGPTHDPDLRSRPPIQTIRKDLIQTLDPDLWNDIMYW